MNTEIKFTDLPFDKKRIVQLLARIVPLVFVLLAATFANGSHRVATRVSTQLTSSGSTSGSYTLNLYSITSASQPGNPGSSSTYVTKSGKLLYPVMFPTVTLDGQLFNDPPCVAVFFRYYTTSKQAGYSRSILPQLLLSIHRLYPYCIDKTLTAITPPTNPTTSLSITRYAITRALPIPNPSFDPPFTLVSIPAYLSTGAALSDNLDLTTSLGRVIANATGVLNINFGDGSPTLTTTSVGGPYPLGTITHTWRSTGCFDVTITENWTVNYKIPNGSGQLTGITTAASIPNYCVYTTTSQIYR